MRMSSVSGLALLFLVVISSAALAEKFPLPTVDYAADTLIRVEKGAGGESLTIPGRIYHSRGSERREAAAMGHQSIVIRNQSSGETWVLMPANRMYMEAGAAGNDRHDPAELWERNQVSMTRLGPETVNGIESVKHRVVATEPDGTTSEGFVWLTEENIPVKLDMTVQSEGKPARMTMEYSNLKIGGQDKSLFEIPADYRKFQMPSMEGEMGMPGGGAMGPGRMAPGGGPGAMSAEEMEQMQKRMREQMEQLQRQMQPRR